VKTKPEECLTLGEYRREVLRQPQTSIARAANCAQGWISQVELGHLPAPWRREQLMRAYRLDRKPGEFERLVLGATRTEALKTPVAKTEPLFATTRAVKAVIDESWADLSESERIVLATYRQMKTKVKQA